MEMDKIIEIIKLLIKIEIGCLVVVVVCYGLAWLYLDLLFIDIRYSIFRFLRPIRLWIHSIKFKAKIRRLDIIDFGLSWEICFPSNEKKYFPGNLLKKVKRRDII